METRTLIGLLLIHWIADFVMQSDEVAKNKSSNNRVLFWHCFLYGFTFLGLMLLIDIWNPTFAFLLGLLHFPVDFVTSRINTNRYKAGDTHGFFVSVGFDQFIHMVTIILLGNALC